MLRIPLILSLTLLSFCMCGVESPTDPDPDEAPAVTVARATQLARAMNGHSMARGFRLRVVDQWERPIPRVPIIGSATTVSSTYDGTGSPFIIGKVNYLSDGSGDVVIPQTKLYRFQAWVDRERIPTAVAIPDDNKAAFYFDATDVRPTGVDEQRLGVDAILRLYRYDGPHPLLAMHAPAQGGLSADGTPFPWSPLQMKMPTARADFEVMVTRDPTAPVVTRRRLLPEEPEENLPNSSAGWTLQLRCLRGGIAPAATQEVAFTAPEDGYRLYRIFRGYDNPRHGCRLRPPQKNMIAMPNVSAWR